MVGRMNKLTLTPDQLRVSQHKGLVSLLVTLLYDLGEEYISKPDTPHNQSVIQACSLLVDVLSEVQQ